MTKAGLIEEMMGDMMDSALDTEDMEDDTDAEVAKVGGVRAAVVVGFRQPMQVGIPDLGLLRVTLTLTLKGLDLFVPYVHALPHPPPLVAQVLAEIAGETAALLPTAQQAAEEATQAEEEPDEMAQLRARLDAVKA
eukprot:365534-Chlamydomonas_euryale.AAC.16